MRSRGGILSSFPILNFFSATIMALPLDIGVTGQYLHLCYRSVPTSVLPVSTTRPAACLLTLITADGPDRSKEEHHEIQSTIRSAALAGAHPVRAHRRLVRRARCGRPAHPDRGGAPMAQPDGRVRRVKRAGGRTGEPARRPSPPQPIRF